MSNWNLKQKLFMLLLALLYRYLLREIYKGDFYSTYKYLGFVYKPDVFMEIGSVLLFVLFTMILFWSVNESKISNYIMWGLYLISFIPFSAMCGCGAFELVFMAGNHLYWFALFFFYKLSVNLRVGKLPKIVVGNYKEVSDYVIVGIGLASIIVNLFIAVKYTGFNLILSLFDVYSLRSAASNANIPSILYYIFCWTRTIGLLLLSLCLLNKKKILSIIFVLNMVQNFLIDGMKTTLFSVVLSLTFYFVMKVRNNKDIYITLFYGIIGISFLSILENTILKSKYIMMFVFYRVEFLVVQIGSYFFDFFIKNEPDYFRSSFLRHFGVVSPYNEYGINYLISGIYFGDYQSSANNGLISDAMTNFGIPGILIMPGILILVFRFFDYCSQGLDGYILVVLGTYIAILLTNGFILTNLMTSGLIVLMIVLMLLKRDKHEDGELKILYR